ncbi:MAG: hypothetical protein GY777_01415 [Candidatus Brocadiaceae bacterium]|nr:hypothetical protein [Candidatus Brocadiaceae bacterium]
MEERVRILVAELEVQRKEIFKLHSTIQEKSNKLMSHLDDEDLINSLAYKLHNLYSAYEDLFKLVAKFFENQIADISGYHTELLNRMRLQIEEVRPKLLSDDSFMLLDELRGFRHVFRHAYSYKLDAERVIKLSEKTALLIALFQKDFEGFKKKIMP